jgi:phospho-N-acetylmuramoyl-pentapeptide-transferase
MIQVFWFKRTGKRVFRMAPIHHHFEMGGWKENRIVLVFSAVGVVFGLLALLAVW